MKSVVSKIPALIRRFRRNEGGNIALLFGIVIPLVGVMVGVAIEYARGADAQLKIQTALDAAVLAGAKRLSDGESDPAKIKEVAQATFLANIGDSLPVFSDLPTASFTINSSTASIEGTTSGTVGHVFALLTDDDKTDIGASSVAGFNTLDLELSMMLDVTGSMGKPASGGGTKLAALKKAAKNAVDILIGENASVSTKNSTRIGLVPYAGAVNVGAFAEVVTGDASLVCVSERSGAEQYSDVSATSAPVGTHPKADEFCPSATITPLTNDAGTLKTEIDGMSDDGWTAGHIGVGWAYYTLSPSWSDIWPGSSKPANYDPDKTMKVALLMTDGEFNTFYDDVTNPFDSTEAIRKSEQATKRLCDSMRSDEIVIYSVAFDAPTDAEALLRDCAGTEDRYFEAETSDELVSAFEQVAADIRDLRLTQ